MTANNHSVETVPGLSFDFSRGPAPLSADVVTRTAVNAGLPVAEVSESPGADAFWMSTVTVDADGRFAAAAAMRRLGWVSDRMTVTGEAHSGVLTISEGGSLRVSAKGMLRLSVAIRQVCNLGAGARLLLVVGPDRTNLYGFTAYAVERWWRMSIGGGPGAGAL